jgi:hypothetical protein
MCTTQSHLHSTENMAPLSGLNKDMQAGPFALPCLAASALSGSQSVTALLFVLGGDLKN